LSRLSRLRRHRPRGRQRPGPGPAPGPGPNPRQQEQDPSTQKFNPRDNEPPRRGGGMSAQDLLRREGRL
ncbi:hypothetical protein, partial [Mycolicibacterium conceptionense]|uniref:hypothetical protein n=1 Tax=Mycolicibacterium conceptionense TaxID=451644 RepID=UPI0010566FC8